MNKTIERALKLAEEAGFEVVDVDNVMDGNIDGFINAFLSGMKIEK